MNLTQLQLIKQADELFNAEYDRARRAEDPLPNRDEILINLVIEQAVLSIMCTDSIIGEEGRVATAFDYIVNINGELGIK